MKALMKALWKIWKTYLQYAGVIIVGGGLVFILIETVRANNTGFETKTLWDWMELLIIPLFLAGGVFYLNRSERTTEREIAIDRQQEAALQSYLDRMTELLLEKDLGNTENEEVRLVAKTRTLTVLRGLDGQRKRYVLQFLRDARLLGALVPVKSPVFNLEGADLRYADLRDADLSSIDLHETNLQYADLRGVRLFETNFKKANLRYANLQNASLSRSFFIETDLSNANMRNVFFKDTNVTDAILQFADLKGATVLPPQTLEFVKTLKGATMPDGTKHN